MLLGYKTGFVRLGHIFDEDNGSPKWWPYCHRWWNAYNEILKLQFGNLLLKEIMTWYSLRIKTFVALEKKFLHNKSRSASTRSIEPCIQKAKILNLILLFCPSDLKWTTTYCTFSCLYFPINTFLRKAYLDAY